jgi:chromate transport protein ChrA
MKRFFPLLPLLLSIWCGFDAVMAVQEGRTGKAIWEAVKAIIFVLVAYLMWDTGKRFSDNT